MGGNGIDGGIDRDSHDDWNAQDLGGNGGVFGECSFVRLHDVGISMFRPIFSLGYKVGPWKTSYTGYNLNFPTYNISSYNC